MSVIYFSTSGTWLCPAGVTYISVVAGGGGGGGSAGSSNWGGGGGGGGAALQQTDIVSVTPTKTYTITIGSGGIGGHYNGASINTCFGSDGYATTITNSLSVIKFYALGGGGTGGEFEDYSLIPPFGGPPFSRSNGFDAYVKGAITSGARSLYTFPGSGGGGSSIVAPAVMPGLAGMMNLIGGFAAGLGGLDGGCYGGGGGAGSKGAGGNAGAGMTNGNGVSAAANTSAGGGGGGSDSTTLIGGQGGNGGSGYLYIVY